MGDMEKWAGMEMGKLGIPESGEIVRYLMTIEEPSEVEEYLVSMLDSKKETHKKFIEDFLKKQLEAKVGIDKRFYKKPDMEEIYGVSKKKKGQKEGSPKDSTSTSTLQTKPQPLAPVNQTNQSTTKKKTKFVSLYSDEGRNHDVVLLSGRHKCECQASKHKLINNCTKCGRIVCEQEGSGPCVFCGDLVVTNEEREILNRGSNKSEALYRRLYKEKNVLLDDAKEKEMPETLKKAIEHKNRLLEFDQTSEKRTKVFDDESDYFNVNSRWISEEDREKLRKREQEIRAKKYDRSSRQYTFDILGRKIVAEEPTGLYDPEDPIVKEILEGNKSDIFYPQSSEVDTTKVSLTRPVYQDLSEGSREFTTKSKFSSSTLMRIQDKELQEMVDEGKCLSMHQPWASLLIAGIKMHEGRMWYSSHRGRLWIAAAAKVPTQDEISNLEQTYRVLFKNDYLQFPQHYPTGCLLGCVTVQNVLPQEEYRQQYPEGESDSPYVFICENPMEMVIKFPIKGEHKIYKLDPKIHQAAKKALRQREE